jgi:predicted RND superfamily exporter protein
MAQLYRKMLARGWWVILIIFVGAAAAGLSRWRDLGIEFQTRTLLDQEDKDFASFEKKHETGAWSESEFAVVCVTAGEWISEEGINRLRDIVVDIESQAHCAGTFSLLDIPLLRQRPGEKPNLFALAGGMKHLGDASPTNWEAARAELLDHELAVGTLISRDGRNLNILVYLKPERTPADQPRGEADGVGTESIPPTVGGRHGDTARVGAGSGAVSGAPAGALSTQDRWQELVHGLRDVAARWEPKLDGPVRLAGVPVIYTYIIERVAHDLRVFGIAAALLFTCGLFFIYRRPALVILPLVASLLPVILILGAMAVFGIRFTVITSNLPLLLFVIALPFTIYLTELYLERRSSNAHESDLDSIATAGATLWTPISYSALTAISGFLAFATSGIVPVRMFGIMMGIGTALSVASTMLFYAAALRGWTAMWAKRSAGAGPDPESAGRGASAAAIRGRFRFAEWFGRLASNRPGAVIAAAAVILILAIAGALRLTAENKFTGYFWPHSAVYKDLEFIDRNTGGTSTLEIYLTAQQPGYFKTPEGLEAVAAIEAFFKSVPETGSVRTLTSRKSFKREWFPEMADAMVLTLVQSTAPELFRDIMSADGSEASLQIRLIETAPTLNRQKILRALEDHIASLRSKELKGLNIEITGIFKLYANMLETLIVSQKETLGFVIVAIYLMLLVLFRSPVLALIVLLPQALPAVTILGIMGWFGIPLDLVTVMIAAIAIGVGVDSAIQYAVRYRRELDIDNDPRAALARSHVTIGRAIWIATTIIVAGFGVLVFSDFFPSVWFGLFTGLAMFMSQFSALIALPALFIVTGYPKPRLRAPKAASDET